MSVQDIDKALSSVCKGEDKKSEAIMLLHLESNWESFLTPLPCAIAILCDLILISADTDFSLEEKPPSGGFKLLRYPNSFRATLVQVCITVSSKFNDSYSLMAQLRLEIKDVDGYIKKVVWCLMQGTTDEVKKILLFLLTKIESIGDKNLELLTEIEDKFIEVLELTGELLNACINTKEFFDEKKKVTEIEIQVATTEKERRVKEVTESHRRLKKTNTEYIAARRRVFTEVPTINRYACMILTIASRQLNEKCEPFAHSDEQTLNQLAYVQSSIESSKNNISKETNSGNLQEVVLNICDEAISICILLARLSKINASKNKEKQVQDLVRRSKKLRTEVQELDVKASKTLAKNPFNNNSPHLSTMHTKNELKESNEKLTQVLMEMANLDLKTNDFDSIRETLIKGIKALAEVREQWGKSLRFFKMLSNLIKCCLHTSLTYFHDHAKQGWEIKMEDHSIPLPNIFRDAIFEQALNASQMVCVSQTIYATYIQIFNDHLMDCITCLGRLVALNPKEEGNKIRLRRHELQNSCAEAQKAIAVIARKQKEEFRHKIDENVAQLSELEPKLPQIEPQLAFDIKACVKAESNISQEELDDLV